MKSDHDYLRDETSYNVAVAKARSMMDKKFNPGSVIEMVPTAPPANPSSPASENRSFTKKVSPERAAFFVLETGVGILNQAFM